MKFTCEKAAIRSAVSLVAKYADTRGHIPIIGHLLVKAEGDQVSVTATDLDKAATAIFPAKIEVEGSACIIADTVERATAQFTGSEFSLTVADDWATVVSGKARLKSPTLPTTDFPTELAMLNGEANCCFSLPADLLESVWKRVGFAIGKDLSRPYLQGVLAAREGDKLQFVATDGKQLSVLETSAPEGVGILPEGCIPLIQFPDWKGDVEVQFGETFARFTASGVTIATKLLETGFPDFWRRAIPDNEKSLIFDREELAKCAARVSINITGIRGSNSILMVGRDGVATLSTENKKGEVSDQIAYDGDDFEIAFTGSILRPALAALDCETLEFLCGDSGATGLFRKPNDDTHRIALWPYRDHRLGSLTHKDDGDAE